MGLIAKRGGLQGGARSFLRRAFSKGIFSCLIGINSQKPVQKAPCVLGKGRAKPLDIRVLRGVCKLIKIVWELLTFCY